MEEHRSADELTAALDDIRRSPAATRHGRADRPPPGRERARGARRGRARSRARARRRRLEGSRQQPHPRPVGEPRRSADADERPGSAGDRGTEERRPLAGDQLYVDLDLSIENLPAGTRLAVGDAVIEVTPEPHTGCAKFSARFGTEALKFVNKSPGRELRLRGVNTRVVTPGTVRAGDAISKL